MAKNDRITVVSLEELIEQHYTLTRDLTIQRQEADRLRGLLAERDRQLAQAERAKAHAWNEADKLRAELARVRRGAGGES
jgi:hypothetical protein